MTKQLVAALVARAVLDGYVDPQASVSTLLPGLPAWTVPIRAHHLVHHTAALPQPPRLAVALGYADEPAGWSRLDNEAVLVALHRVAPSPVPPGREFRYDNTGYILLAELLQAMHGRDVAALARSKLFGPLGLAGSRMGDRLQWRFPAVPRRLQRSVTEGCGLAWPTC